MSAAARLAQAMRPLDVQQRHALADTLGLLRVVVARAYAGRPTNADAYVSLCEAIGFDPLRDRKVPAPKPVALAVNWKALAIGLAVKRNVCKLNQRDAAALVEATATAFCRVEQGRPVSAENLLKICRFIGVSPLGYADVSHMKQHCNTLESNEGAA